MPLHDAMFVESNPGPVKYAAERLGLCSATMRLPLVEITDKTKETVDKALVSAGILNG